MDNNVIANSIKTLRKKNGVSQEKLAEYVGVSFQAVSKWENGTTMPDIMLLPEISRFFGITVDELLQVEAVNNDKQYREYYEKAQKYFAGGDMEKHLATWKEAFHNLPNRIDVKEKLMSAFFDLDKVKYADNIIELGMEIASYKGEIPPIDDIHGGDMYYQSQAIRMLAVVYHALGKQDLSEKWARKASPLFNCQDIIFAETSEGDDMIRDGGYCVYWFVKELYHFANRIMKDDKVTSSVEEKIKACETVALIHEAVYPNDDMGYESFYELCNLYLMMIQMHINDIGESERTKCWKNRVRELVNKASKIEAHELKHPLMKGIMVTSCNNDNQIVELIGDLLE